MDTKIKQHNQQKQLSIYENDIYVDWVDEFDKTVDFDNLNIILEQLLSSIKERESSIIKLYYGFNNDESLNYREIGNIFNISGSRVSEISHKGLRKLRHPARAKQIKSYYDEYISCVKECDNEDVTVRPISPQNNKQKYPSTMEEKKKKEIMNIYNSLDFKQKIFIDSIGFNDFLNSDDINFLIKVEFYIKDRFKFYNEYKDKTISKNVLEYFNLSFNSTINIYYLLRACFKIEAISLNNICLLLTPEEILKIKSSKIIPIPVLEELGTHIFKIYQQSSVLIPYLLKSNFILANKFYKIIYGYELFNCQDNRLKVLFYISVYVKLFKSIPYYNYSKQYTLLNIRLGFKYINSNFDYEKFLDIVDDYTMLNKPECVSPYKRLNQLVLPPRVWLLLKLNNIKNYNDLFKYFDFDKEYFNINGFGISDYNVFVSRLIEACIL